jgi:hypothetical protein
VVINGNALRPSGDLVRRFPMWCRLDARMENPALRKFPLADEAFLADTERRRPELLAALLMIWRWGRQQGGALPHGEELGTYTDWCRWIRDPLVALGCADVVKRIGELAEADPKAAAIGELYGVWWDKHKGYWVPANDLDLSVRKIANPDDHSRQWLTSYLDSLQGTRVGPFTLERAKEHKWTPATYRLIRVDPPAS